eukprot:jgi/Tetstr1/445002/TSEL_032810.t1
MAECAVAAAARLRACQAAEDAAGLLEGGLLGMLRQGCCGEALAVACSEALLRWADAPAVAQLLLGLGGTGSGGDKEEDALRVKDEELRNVHGPQLVNCLMDPTATDMGEYTVSL